MIVKEDSRYLFIIYYESDQSEPFKKFYGSVDDSVKIGIEWYNVLDDVNGHFMSRPLKIGNYIIVAVDLSHKDIPHKFKKYKRDVTIYKMIDCDIL